MMKRLLVTMMTLLLVLTICSCSEDQKNDTNPQEEIAQDNSEPQMDQMAQMMSQAQSKNLSHVKGHTKEELVTISEEFKRYEEANEFRPNPPEDNIVIDGNIDIDSLRQYLPKINKEYYQRYNYLIGLQLANPIQPLIHHGANLDLIMKYLEDLINQKNLPYDFQELMMVADTVNNFLARSDGQKDFPITEEAFERIKTDKKFWEKVNMLVARDHFLSTTHENNIIDLDYLRLGIEDKMNNNGMIYPLETIMETDADIHIMRYYFHQNREKNLRSKMQVDDNQTEQFLARYRENPELVTTESGLMYRMITPGTGDSPGPETIARFNIRESVVNGREIINTFNSKAIEGKIDNGVAGYVEAFSLLKVGGRMEIVLLPHLAYGENGEQSMNIPPNTTIMAEIELLGILKK